MNENKEKWLNSASFAKYVFYLMSGWVMGVTLTFTTANLINAIILGFILLFMSISLFYLCNWQLKNISDSHGKRQIQHEREG